MFPGEVDTDFIRRTCEVVEIRECAINEINK